MRRDTSVRFVELHVLGLDIPGLGIERFVLGHRCGRARGIPFPLQFRIYACYA